MSLGKDMNGYKKAVTKEGKKKGLVGDDLRSQRVAPQVPSARAGLTAGFGMGPGGPPPLQSPTRPFEWSIVNDELTINN